MAHLKIFISVFGEQSFKTEIFFAGSGLQMTVKSRRTKTYTFHSKRWIPNFVKDYVDFL